MLTKLLKLPDLEIVFPDRVHPDNCVMVKCNNNTRTGVVLVTRGRGCPMLILEAPSWSKTTA